MRRLGGALGGLDAIIRGCGYLGGDEVGGKLREVAREGGCALSLLFHNIRSARGVGMELLEAELRRWAVQWDVVGLADTWLDAESEKGVSMMGYGVVCASRRSKAGGGVALMVRDGLTYRERPDLGTFDEGIFESVFVEIVRGGGRRNDLVGVIYRPPRGDLGGFNDEMARVLGLIQGTDAYSCRVTFSITLTEKLGKVVELEFLLAKKSPIVLLLNAMVSLLRRNLKE